MAQTVCVLLNASDAARLVAIASGDRSRPLEQAQRARIVLLSARAPEGPRRRLAGGRQPPGRVALAVALRRGWRRRSAARQDTSARHPRWTFHFTPTSAAWLNAVEGFFSALTRRRLRRGSFTGVVDLQAAIKRYIAEHNRSAKPFVWTKPATDILAAVSRSPEPSV